MSSAISERRRREVIDALRRGTVPQHGLDVLAVGLDRFTTAIDGELDVIAGGGSVFKAVRGEYGAGKTFFARWVQERAKRRGMATAEVQISETETPLHRLETVYRRVTESLSTSEFPPSALRPVLDAWMFTLEEDVLAGGTVSESDTGGLDAAVGALLERRLAEVSRTAPTFAAALRGFRSATTAGDVVTADGLVAWLGGQPHVAASVRRSAGVRGELDHFGAFGFLQGLLTVLRDSGHPGLLLVFDEVETLQRMRSDVRDKALNALRQLADEVDSGRFPGLYLLLTGTPAFFDGTQGAQRLPPLSQRLATDFTTDAASTTHGRCRSGCRASPWRASVSWAARSETSTSPARRLVIASRPSSTTRTSPRWPPRSRVGWAGRSASRRGCSSRSWLARCSTESTSSPISTRAVTTG